jgi:predicted dehydrogenase
MASASSSAAPIRVGIIGCGQIAQSHLSTYQNIPEAQVVAVADIIEDKARASADKFGVPNVYNSMHPLLAREDIDAVDICLHNNLHRSATEAALKAGKHVYCEKPMAGSYRDAAAMLEAARKQGKKLAIQLANVFADETRAAKELIDGGKLGALYHARSTGFRRRGRPFVDGYGSINFVQKEISAGGALYDMGVYHIAQMLYLLGNPKVARITGKTYQKTEMDAGRRAESGYSVEELGVGFVRFEGDLSLDIIEAWAIQLDTFEGSSLVGAKGGIRLSPFGFFSSEGDLSLNTTVDLKAARYRWDKIRGNGAYYGGSQAHWIAGLQGKVELLPTAEIALNTMLISEGIYLSEKLGREVTAAEVAESSVSTVIPV